MHYDRGFKQDNEIYKVDFSKVPGDTGKKGLSSTGRGYQDQSRGRGLYA